MAIILLSILYPTVNISLLELVRAAVGLIGIGASLSLALRTYNDLILLWKSGKNSLREYSARTSVRLHISLLVLQILLFGITVLAMTQPRPMHTNTGWISSAIYIVIVVLLCTMSVETDRRKRNLVDMIMKKLPDD